MEHQGMHSLLKHLYKINEEKRLKKLYEEYVEEANYKGSYSAYSTSINRLKKKGLVEKAGRGIYKINDRGINAVRSWEKEKNRKNEKQESCYDDKYEKLLLNEEFKDQILQALHENRHFLLDLSKFSKEKMDLLQKMEEKPEQEYFYLSEAFKKIQDEKYFKKDFFEKTESHIYLTNIPGYLDRSIVSAKSSKHLNELISVEGMVIQKTELHPVLVETIYECTNCGEEFLKEHEDEKTEPHKCRCGCRNFDEVENRYEDVFSIWIQENLDDSIGKSEDIQVVFQGKQVDEKLRDKFTVGDQMKVAGIPRDIEAEKNGLKRTVYLEGLGFDKGELTWDSVELTDEDKKKLKEIDRETFINSHAGHLVGEDAYLLRFCSVLSIVSAHDRWTTSRKKMSGNIHTLLVTPPSEGKSDILKETTSLYPRSEYADCTNSTPTGLIASAEKSEETGEWRLKAKTLVKANKGVACLDEFDNLSDGDKKAYEKMNESLESQQATIEKASISTVLPTDCSVIAAANPKYGDFDLNKGIVDQFPNAAASTLSRFDLQVVSKGVQERFNDEKVADAMQGKVVNTDDFLSENVLRKYVKFAKSFEPVWPDECRERVSEFYADVREKSDKIGQKVRSRMVRTVQNVSLALARIDFCEEASLEHVEEAIDLLKELFDRKGFDLEGGEFDFDYVDGGKGRRNLEKDAVLEFIPDTGDGVAVEEVYSGFDVSDDRIDGILANLKNEGEVFEPEPGRLKKL